MRDELIVKGFGVVGTVHFLLVYSLREGKLVAQEEFTDAVTATSAYTARERQFRNTDDFEIVLVGSDSIETVMKTHGHYFRSSDDSMFSDLLAAV